MSAVAPAEPAPATRTEGREASSGIEASPREPRCAFRARSGALTARFASRFREMRCLESPGSFRESGDGGMGSFRASTERAIEHDPVPEGRGKRAIMQPRMNHREGMSAERHGGRNRAGLRMRAFRDRSERASLRISELRGAGVTFSCRKLGSTRTIEGVERGVGRVGIDKGCCHHSTVRADFMHGATQNRGGRCRTSTREGGKGSAPWPGPFPQTRS